ncbi:ribonuclease P [Halomicroarcula sp. F28]|uniref:RNase P subunit p30 family protein n=1 Tax=Haloarcula salinisoli TaxID=2487746 RepID=UPI001C73B517|nr:RNase P subunit p30 family protein [Halomicroarcula salinisoli]MBX0285768.1 ribonuclease P [Halomicroarcula salinisoli]
MYEAVHARPDGPSTLARQAETAADYGFEGVVVRNHGDEGEPDDITAVREAVDVDVVDGVEIRADDPSQASGLVGNYRSKQTVVVVHGGDSAVNRFAVETPAVDVLAHPMAGDGDFNHVLATAAADNDVRVEFNLHPVIQGEGGSRVRRLRGLRKLRELVADADAPFVVSADPRSHLELRAPRELAALGEAIGFDADDIRSGLAEWGRLAARNRDRMGDSYVEPGVRLDDS